VVIWFIAKHFASLPLFGRLVLKDPVPGDDETGAELLAAMDPETGAPVRVGMTGRAETPLRPAGRIQIGERVIDAVADFGYIPAGTPVVVTSVSEFRVGVERSPEGGRA